MPNRPRFQGPGRNRPRGNIVFRRKKQKPQPPKAAVYTPPKGTPGALSITTTPDYLALLQANPAYSALRATTQAQVGQAASQRAAALRGLVQQFGKFTGTDTYGDIRPEDLGLASSNPFSAQAQLERSYASGQDTMRRQLAARGALRSGELGHGQGQLEMQRGQADYELGQEFLQAMSDAISNYQGVESGAFTNEADLIREISGQIATANPVSVRSAKLDQQLTRRYKLPIYRGPDGRLWIKGPDGPKEWSLGNRGSGLPVVINAGGQF
jgi:hypothetical protein